MNISLHGQTIVVTGGAKRLGRAIALECALAGAHVVITYRSSEAQARQTVSELQEIAPGAQFAALALDVSDGAAVEAFSERVFENFPNVSGLVNNAAIFRRTPFDVLEESDFDDHINANLKGPFLLCRAFGSRFMAENGGSIVNMADIYGQKPLGNYIPYCISKAGVVMLTQTLAKALAPRVRVNCLCPGTILPPSQQQSEIGSEMGEEAQLLRRIPFGRVGEPSEIAQTAVFLLGGPAFITGAVLSVDGGQSLR